MHLLESEKKHNAFDAAIFHKMPENESDYILIRTEWDEGTSEVVYFSFYLIKVFARIIEWMEMRYFMLPAKNHFRCCEPRRVKRRYDHAKRISSVLYPLPLHSAIH